MTTNGKIWLFKPRIRLAYTTLRHHAIPKSANVLAAKVLFKLLGPVERQMNIKRQGFFVLCLNSVLMVVEASWISILVFLRQNIFRIQCRRVGKLQRC